MLEFLREKAGSWVIKILLFFIAAVFIFTGIDVINAPKKRSIAIVNDKEISMGDFQLLYDNQLNRLKAQFGGQLNEETLKMLQLKQKTFDNLVNRELLIQKAKSLGLIVSDQELGTAIHSMFKDQGGNFSQEIYRSSLSANGITTEQFEASQREQMMIGKLQAIILSSVKVTDMELEEWYNWENSAVDLMYASFDPEAYKNIEIKDSDLAQYFEKNKENYKTPAQMQVKYVKIKNEDYKEKVKVSDEEANEYYNDNIENYRMEQTAKARHILIKTDSKDEPAKVEEAKKRAEKVLAEVKAGGDFAKLADQYTEDPSGKGKGGDLGEFTRQKMVKPFSDAAFALKPGEISDLVKTDFGWHIIKLESLSPEFKKYADVSEDIKKSIVNEKYKTLAYDDAEKVYEVILKGDNLDQASKAVDGLKIETTGLFSRKDGLKDQFSDPSAITEAAFNLNPGQISEIIENDAELVIIEAVKKVDPSDVTLDSVKERVRADFTKVKMDEAAKAKAEAFLADLAKGQDFKAKAAEYKVKMSETGSFKRNGVLPAELGYAPELSKTAFELSDKNQVPKNPMKIENRYYVFKFKGRTSPDMAAFEKDKDALKTKTLKTKQDDFFNSWLADLKKQSKIKVLQPKILE